MDIREMAVDLSLILMKHFKVLPVFPKKAQPYSSKDALLLQNALSNKYSKIEHT